MVVHEMHQMKNCNVQTLNDNEAPNEVLHSVTAGSAEGHTRCDKYADVTSVLLKKWKQKRLRACDALKAGKSSFVQQSSETVSVGSKWYKMFRSSKSKTEDEAGRDFLEKLILGAKHHEATHRRLESHKDVIL